MDFKQNLCAALSNACGMTAEQIGDMLETCLLYTSDAADEL